MPPASRHHVRSKPLGSTNVRGYGAEHRKARKLAASQHKPSDPCARCGDELGPMGPHLHYDHDGERTGYFGFSHARCNNRAGAQEGRRRQGQLMGEQQPTRPRRDWYA